jgi:hypothetical protein
MAALDKTDSSRWPARMKDAGDVVDSLKTQLGIRPRDRAKKIAWHEKVRRIVIRNALRRHSLLWAGFLYAADERLTFVMGPVTDLVGQGKRLRL